METVVDPFFPVLLSSGGREVGWGYRGRAVPVEGVEGILFGNDSPTTAVLLITLVSVKDRRSRGWGLSQCLKSLYYVG